MRIARRLAATLLAAGLLGACATGPDAAPATAEPGAAPGEASAAVAALPPQAPPPPDPAKFIGMTTSELTGMLGEPSFRRRDPPAEIWQYRSGTCVLDLFLYSDGREKPTYAVTHAEVRMRGSTMRPDAECLARIVRERTAAPTS